MLAADRFISSLEQFARDEASDDDDAAAVALAFPVSTVPLNTQIASSSHRRRHCCRAATSQS